jgi:uncharacterized protein YkwD
VAGGATVSSTTTTTLAASSIVSNVIPATYGAGSDRQGAYDYLNAQRGACGFGMLQQHVKLDQAAQAHTDYLVTNNLLLGHYEDQQQFPTGFTGVAPSDRITAAGYQWTATTEVIAGSRPSLLFGTTDAQARVMELFSVPYHGVAMLRNYREIGIGYNGVSPRSTLIFDMATSSTMPSQNLASNIVATYPCNGSAGILAKTYSDETPTPIAGRNLQTQPIGHPIYLLARASQALSLTSSDLREVGTQTALATTVLTQATDANGQLASNEIIVMPTAPLAINTTYRFQAQGTNNGQPFTVNFTFTTGGN